LTAKNDISADYMKLYNFVIAYNEKKAELASDVEILKSVRVNINENMAQPVINKDQYIGDSQFDFDERHGLGHNNGTMYGDTVILHTGAVRFQDSTDSVGQTVSLGDWTNNTLLQAMAVQFNEDGSPALPKDCYSKFNTPFMDTSKAITQEPDLADGGLTIGIQRVAMIDLMKKSRDITNFLNNKKEDSEEAIEFKKNIKIFFKEAVGIEENQIGWLTHKKANRARLLNDDGSVNTKAVAALSYLAENDRFGGIFKTFAKKQFLSDGLEYCGYNFLSREEFMKGIGDADFVRTMRMGATHVANRIKISAPEEAADVVRNTWGKVNAIGAAAVFNNSFTGNNPSEEITRITESSIKRMMGNLVIQDSKVKGSDAELYATMLRLQSSLYKTQNSMSALSHGIQSRWSQISNKIIEAQFNGKKNGIRQGIVIKRMDLSATTVICEDPSLPVDAIGVNHDMMKRMKLRSYEESMNDVRNLVETTVNDKDVDRLIEAMGIGQGDVLNSYEDFITETKNKVEMLANYCRYPAVKAVLIDDMKPTNKNLAVDETLIAEARQLCDEIVGDICGEVTDKMTAKKAMKDVTKLAMKFSTNRDYVAIWRDPVLRGEGAKYLKVYEDDMCAGVTINPVMDKGFDMDFDGDTIGMHTQLNPALHKEAVDVLTISGKNIADGRDINYEFGHDYDTAFRVYKTIMQDGLDLASAESKDEQIPIIREDMQKAILDMANDKLDMLTALNGDGYDENDRVALMDKYDDIKNKIMNDGTATISTIRETFTVMASDMRKEYEADTSAADPVKSDLCIDLMNLYAQEALGHECGTDCARYDSLEGHISALAQMVEHGVKGSNKKLKSYLQYMGAQNIDNIVDSEGQLHIDEVQGLNETNDISGDTIRGTQKAQSVKSVGTGVAGELTIDATKMFFDMQNNRNNFLAILDVAQLTSQITQSTLQAKHDPVEALNRYAAISGPAKDLFSGCKIGRGMNGDWYVDRNKEQPITKEEWVECVVEFYEAEDGLNIKPVNKYNIENLADIVFSDDGEQLTPTTFFGIGYKAGDIMPKVDEAVAEHRELFEGRTKIYASDTFLNRFNEETVQTEAEPEKYQAAYEKSDEYEEEMESETSYTYCEAMAKTSNDEHEDIPSESELGYEEGDEGESEELDGSNSVA